ncbi:MAG TPA: hypothetical protein PL163_20915 [Leptospiraceae bacterium]|nr:hypothetical protein [Leptospiraceae bacterium]HMY69118.1 hypothetical protein [Leptospiraceae bacterium]
MVILICLTGRREDMFRIKSLTVSAVLFFHLIGCSSSLIFPVTRVTNRWILEEDREENLSDFSVINGIKESDGHCFFYDHNLFNKELYSCYKSWKLHKFLKEQNRVQSFDSYYKKNGYQIKNWKNKIFFTDGIYRRSVDLSEYLQSGCCEKVGMQLFGDGIKINKVYISKDRQYLYFSENKNRFFALEFFAKEGSVKLYPYSISNSLISSVGSPKIWLDRESEVFPIFHTYPKSSSLPNLKSETALPLHNLTELKQEEQDKKLTMVFFPNSANIPENPMFLLIEDGKPDYYLDTYVMRNKTKLNYLLFSLNAVTVPLDLALIPALIIGAPIYMTIAVLLYPVKI